MEKVSDLSRFFVYFIIAIVSCVFILIFIAFFTLTERKLMGLLQRREGPDKVGFEGILQPIADGVKLAKKEVIKPKDNMNPFLFSVAPMISFTVSVSL
jgi:NADH:ubiquinone oxidoreductase subunit H